MLSENEFVLIVNGTVEEKRQALFWILRGFADHKYYYPIADCRIEDLMHDEDGNSIPVSDEAIMKYIDTVGDNDNAICMNEKDPMILRSECPCMWPNWDDEMADLAGHVPNAIFLLCRKGERDYSLDCEYYCGKDSDQ